MGQGRPVKLLVVAAVAAFALIAAAPASAFTAAEGEYKGNGGGHHIHFTVKAHHVHDFRVGGAFFFSSAYLGNKSFDTFQHGRRTYGDWCDQNHLKGAWTRHTSRGTVVIPFHAHRIHHGDEGHRCP